MSLKNNTKEIENIIKTANVLNTYEERYCYAQDATHTFDIQELPNSIIFVESIEDVQNVLRIANKNKIPVIARGAGTNMVGACTCPQGGIVMCFSKMNKILDFNPVNMSIKVQPGVVLGDLKSFVELHGLFYPPDPSNYKVSTIGGSIAQASGGAMSYKYGNTKDYILSLTVVLADGTVTKLGSGMLKDATGYHLNQLIVGSEGTLAIVVEAELRLLPQPESKRLIVAYFNNNDDIINCVSDFSKSNIVPSTIDYMDKNSINIIEQTFHSGLNTSIGPMLLIEFDGFESSMNQQEEMIISCLKFNNAIDYKVAYSPDEQEIIWKARRSSYAAITKTAPNVVSDDIIVPRNKLAEMLNFCQQLFAKYDLNLFLVAHIGDGNLHPQIALNLENELEYKNLLDAKNEMYIKTKELGGTLSAEHGIGVTKKSYLTKFIPEKNIELMKTIKVVFDPNNILNPGKIF